MAGCSLINSKQCLKHFHAESKKQNEEVLFGEVESSEFLENQRSYFFRHFPLLKSTNSEIQVSQKLTNLL